MSMQSDHFLRVKYIQSDLFLRVEQVYVLQFSKTDELFSDLAGVNLKCEKLTSCKSIEAYLAS